MSVATSFTVSNSGSSAYVVDGVSNKPLVFIRGQVYAFIINTPGHPFWINTVQGTGTAGAFSSGVTNNGASSNTLVFVVPTTAPDRLYYNCEYHSSMTAVITVFNGTTIKLTVEFG
jgi:hypothetical protein